MGLLLNAELDKLRRERALTFEQLASTLKVSVPQISKLISGQSGTTPAFVKKLGEIFNVAPESLVKGGALYLRREGWKFNTRKGLKEEGAPQVGADEAPFQNFIGDDKARVSLAYIWSELNGDALRLAPLKAGPRDLGAGLAVDVTFSGKASAPNVAIHPQHLLPRQPLNTQRFFAFEARYRKFKAARTVVPTLGLRIGDALHFQWLYRADGEQFYFPLNPTFKVYYADFRNVASWRMMDPSKGRRGGPRFDLLTTVVFDFGFGSESNIGSPGAATVEIKNLCLCGSRPFTPRLPKGTRRRDFPVRNCYDWSPQSDLA